MTRPSPLTLPALLVLLLAAAARSAPAQALMPDHRPVGADLPLEAGAWITVAPARVFRAPSLADSAVFLDGARRARVLAARNNFYQLDFVADGLRRPALTGWVYRSELEVRPGPRAAASGDLPAVLDRPRPQRVPAAGDTLSLAAPLLYDKADLLGDHEQLPGRQVLRVLAAEDAQGFLRVRTDTDRTGFVHRAELPEDRRRPR